MVQKWFNWCKKGRIGAKMVKKVINGAKGYKMVQKWYKLCKKGRHANIWFGNGAIMVQKLYKVAISPNYLNNHPLPNSL